MRENDDFDYKDLRARGDLAIELIVQVLTTLDLFISATVNKESGKIDEVIFADRTSYMKHGEKKGVATEFKTLNSIVFDKEKDIPEFIKKKHKDNIIFLDKKRVDK